MGPEDAKPARKKTWIAARALLAAGGVALAWLLVEWQRLCLISGLKPERVWLESRPVADTIARDGERWPFPLQQWLGEAETCLLRDVSAWEMSVLQLPEGLWLQAVYWAGYWVLFLLLAGAVLLIAWRPRTGSEVVLRTGFVLCLAVGLLALGFNAYEFIRETDNENVNLAIGALTFVFLALLPFTFPRSRLSLLQRFELAGLLGGGFIAVVTAAFLLNEYQDQRQARITRAWDLLHKARDEAHERMDAAVERERAIRRAAAEQAAGQLKQCLAGGVPQCEKEQESVDAANAALSKLNNDDGAEVRRLRRDARGGNDGQIGALQTLYREKVDLTGLHVAEMYLGGLVLSGNRPANLRRASFQHADLVGADLRSADLGRADFRGTDLRGADLGGANLINANLKGAGLADADLRSAELIGANLGGANLSEANLGFANLFGAYLKGTNLGIADLSRGNLMRANLSGAILGGASLRDADLSIANLNGANLKGADLSGVNLKGADLSGGDLRSANLRSANLVDANLSNTNLRGANLWHATFCDQPNRLGADWNDESPPRNLDAIRIRPDLCQ